MAPTFSPNALVPQLVAAQALTQLNRQAVFAKAALGNYEPTAFQKGDTVTIRRARIVEAEDYDPRSGTSANSTEPGYSSATLTLEKLFTGGFPVYGQDGSEQRSKYINEYGEQIASAIGTSDDNYLYSKFRTLTIASSGAVAYNAQPPVGIVAAQSNGSFTGFDKSLLINAGVLLNTRNVPGANRYAILSSAAAGSFLGDAVMVEGFAATAAGSANLLVGGLTPGLFVPRYGFMTSSSNAVTSQAAQSDLDSAASSQPTLAIASVAANTSFTEADYATTTYLGAIDITLTVSGSLQNVAVGAIAKIAPASGNTVAYGLILRVAGSVVTLVPFSPSGAKLSTTDITPGTHVFSIPMIPSVSVAYHRESLMFAVRNLAEPSDGSGATMATVSNSDSGLAIQVIKGNYQVDRFLESQRYAMLTGAMLTDHRKACLMLSL